MLGYVTIEKNELKVREYELYQAYYCGICKAIGKRCGPLPRLNLSYDSVFLALILAGLNNQKESIGQERCITHHIKKRPVVIDNSAVDYAADVMVILAYHKFLDDWQDDRSALGFAGKTALTGAYKKLRKRYPEICQRVQKSLEELSALESESCGKLDLVSDIFADVMEVLFTGYLQEALPASTQRILGQLGRSLGHWIYVIDALDDYEKDKEKGTYNPLIFRKNHLEGIGDLLYNYLAEIVKAYDLLQIEKNTGIIENIILMGLRLRTDVILKERTETHE